MAAAARHLGRRALATSVIATMPFQIVVTRRFVRKVEAALRTTLGAEAERYIATTRRW